MEIHPGRGSASKSFSVYFFIVLGNFCTLSCIFLCFGRFLHVFACFYMFFSSWGALGTLLGALGTLLGRSWDALGCSWELLEGSWSALGRSWDALGTLLDAFGTLLDAFGHSCSIKTSSKLLPRPILVDLGSILTRFWCLHRRCFVVFSNSCRRQCLHF